MKNVRVSSCPGSTASEYNGKYCIWPLDLLVDGELCLVVNTMQPVQAAILHLSWPDGGTENGIVWPVMALLSIHALECAYSDLTSGKYYCRK